MHSRGPLLSKHAALRIRERAIPYRAVRATFLSPFVTGDAPQGTEFSVASVLLGVRRSWLTLIRDADSDLVVTVYEGGPRWRRRA